MKACHTITILAYLCTTTLGAVITRSTLAPTKVGGFNASEINAPGFNATGFNATGFNAPGFNATGFNATGFNATRYNGKEVRATDVNTTGVDMPASIKASTGGPKTGFRPPVRRQASETGPEASSVGGSSPLPSATGNSSANSVPGINGGSTGGGPFVPYSGPSSSFPDPAEWASFSKLWDQATPEMTLSGNSDSENDLIKEAIMTVSTSSGIDCRTILEMIMQESTGNVRAPSTNNGVKNSGLMQSHAGTGFEPANPEQSILQMIRDGAEGTPNGDGLTQTLEAQQGDIYEAFRKYNSGSVNQQDLNDGLGATDLYVQKMANRLMGAEKAAA